MTYHFICSDGTDPYQNLALEQCLFSETGKGRILLYLWQNDHTIVVGRNQDVYAECRAEEFLQSGGRIARRRSGGGAVYQDLGNLNFSLLGEEQALAPGVCEGLILKALQGLGIRAEFNGRNDLLVDGKKFSGTAFYERGGILCRHGTLLIDTDIEAMARFLTPDRGKLERNRVKSVPSRVENLSELVPDLTAERLKEALLRAADARPLAYQADRKLLKEQEAFFRKKEWIFGGNA